MNQTKFNLFALVTVITLVTSLGVWVQVKSATQETNTGVPEIVSYQGNIWDGVTPYNGTGYFKFAIMDATGTTLYWSNDGADPPAASVTRDVINGLFSVNLGDTSLPGMADPLGASVFDNPDTRLRVWFSPDNVTWTQMPDQVIAAVPYALQAQQAGLANEAYYAVEAGLAHNSEQLEGFIATDFQLRVTGTCPAGQYIQSINSDGTVVCGLMPVFPTFTLTTVASSGDMGKTSSIVIGSDGLGIISFYDNTYHDLVVFHCDDINCTSGDYHPVDTDADVGQYTSIAIGTDGYPLISYYDVTSSSLNVAHCNDVACISSSNVTILDSANDVGKFTSITIGGDGYGLISYYDITNKDLKIAHCTNLPCTTFEINVVGSSTGDVGQKTHIVTGTDGYGFVIGYDDSWGLRLAHCGDYACSPGSLFYGTVGFGIRSGYFNDLIIGPDGFVWIIFSYDFGVGTIRCQNIDCTVLTNYYTDINEEVETLSFALGTDDLGIFSYKDIYSNLIISHCDNEGCTKTTTSTLDSYEDVGIMSSIVIGEDGLPLISYYDETNADLKVAHCSNELCLPIFREE
jgi:hypothetical protein